MNNCSMCLFDLLFGPSMNLMFCLLFPIIYWSITDFNLVCIAPCCKPANTWGRMGAARSYELSYQAVRVLAAHTVALERATANTQRKGSNHLPSLLAGWSPCQLTLTPWLHSFSHGPRSTVLLSCIRQGPTRGQISALKVSNWGKFNKGAFIKGWAGFNPFPV